MPEAPILGRLRGRHSRFNVLDQRNLLAFDKLNHILAMAIARPIRVLALAAIVLWGFFIYVIFSPKKSPTGPGDIIGSSHIPEPLLDSTCRSSKRFVDEQS